MGNGIWRGFVAHTTQDLSARIGIHAGSTSAEPAAPLRMSSDPDMRKRWSNAELEPPSGFLGARKSCGTKAWRARGKAAMI
jgi:hypothetical protein